MTEPAGAPVKDDVLAALLENRRGFLRFVERRVGSPEEAEEVLQEAFTRAVAKRSTLRDEESALAWFYRMLRNAVVDLYRRKDSSKRALEAFGRELTEVQPGSDLHGEVCACVSRVASSLKPEYAEVLREVDVEGLPVKAPRSARESQPETPRSGSIAPGAPSRSKSSRRVARVLTTDVSTASAGRRKAQRRPKRRNGRFPCAKRWRRCNAPRVGASARSYSRLAARRER